MDWLWIVLVLVVLVVVVTRLTRGRGAGRQNVDERTPSPVTEHTEHTKHNGHTGPADQSDPDPSGARPGSGHLDPAATQGSGDRSEADRPGSGDLADPHGGRGETSYRDRELPAQTERELREFERSEEQLFDEDDRERLRPGQEDQGVEDPDEPGDPSNPRP